MICFHHNDLDGRCAAAIVRKWFHERDSLIGDARHDIIFVELDYKDRVPVEIIGLDEEIAIVDFSFKPEVMAEVLKRNHRINWCDHHKTAAAYDYGRELAGLRDFTEKGKSGCEVTWDYFFSHLAVPPAVRLLGDYDAWRLEQGDKTFQFYEGLKLRDMGPHSTDWWCLFNWKSGESEALLDIICEEGRAAILYRDNYCREIMRAFGYETKIDGVQAYATNFYRFGSQGFVENWKKYPVCIAYIHDGSRYTVSLYSETIDVGEIARKHGGGGHKGAAGFVCDSLPFKALRT